MYVVLSDNPFWPDDFILHLAMNDESLLQALWALASSNLEHAPTVPSLSPEHITRPAAADAGRVAGALSSWLTYWHQTLSWVADTSERHAAVHSAFSESRMNGAFIQQNLPPAPPVEFELTALERVNFLELLERLNSMDDASPHHAAAYDSAQSIEGARTRGLTTLVVLPLDSYHAEAIEGKALLLSEKTYYDRSRFEQALADFPTVTQEAFG